MIFKKWPYSCLRHAATFLNNSMTMGMNLSYRRRFKSISLFSLTFSSTLMRSYDLGYEMKTLNKPSMVSRSLI